MYFFLCELVHCTKNCNRVRSISKSKGTSYRNLFVLSILSSRSLKSVFLKMNTFPLYTWFSLQNYFKHQMKINCCSTQQKYIKEETVICFYVIWDKNIRLVRPTLSVGLPTCYWIRKDFTLTLFFLIYAKTHSSTFGVFK